MPNSDLLAGWTVTNPASGIQHQVSRAYEPQRDLLTAVSNTAGGNLVSAFVYQNDTLGRRAERVDNGVVQNAFEYNARSKLVSADIYSATADRATVARLR